MALARPRPSRPHATRPSPRPAPDERDAMAATEEESLAELVAAAAEANERSLRDVADEMRLERAALETLLLRPSSLARDTIDRLAHALGVDRTLFRRAVQAAAARERPPHDEHGDDASAEPGAPGAAGRPTPTPDATSTVEREAVDAGAAGAAPSRPPPPPAEPPLEAIDVVARALRAIADEGADAPLRPAVLEAVRHAARDAGRPVPPAWRDVAAALHAAPAVPNPLDADEPAGSDPPEPETAAARDGAVVEAAARAVRALQRLAPGYDDVFSPLPDEALAELLRRLTIRTHRAPLGSRGASALVAPTFGRYLLVHSTGATDDQRRLAERRAAAHVVAGHVRADAPLPVPPTVDGPFDRVADVAALADLVPFWLLHDLRRARGGGKAVVAHVTALVTQIAADWDERRVRDRAALRVELHRRHGL